MNIKPENNQSYSNNEMESVNDMSCHEYATYCEQHTSYALLSVAQQF